MTANVNRESSEGPATGFQCRSEFLRTSGDVIGLFLRGKRTSVELNFGENRVALLLFRVIEAGPSICHYGERRPQMDTDAVTKHEDARPGFQTRIGKCWKYL